LEESITLDIDFGVDCDEALSSATTSEIIDLAGILGLHSIMNQDQYHGLQSVESYSNVGWNSVTKSTPTRKVRKCPDFIYLVVKNILSFFYQFEEDGPNLTDPDEIIRTLKINDPSVVKVNLNNIPMKNDQFMVKV